MNSNPQSRSCILKPSNKKRLIAVIRQAAAKECIDWDRHYSRADQVIVFGSYAVGFNRRDSDIDVLCIGRGKPYRSAVLQIIWMSHSRLDRHVRRGSELAVHIAAFGVWLKGHRSLPRCIAPSQQTIIHRRDQIVARCRAVANRWSLLESNFKRKHASKIRRDLQRLTLLKSGRANIPAPALDDQWRGVRQKAQCLYKWFEEEPTLRRSCDRKLMTLLTRSSS
jgi:predicted nucleotidyltransferase